MTSAWGRKIAAFVLFIIAGVAAFPQSVTPPIAEFRGLKADGSFRIDNKTAEPMMVVLETKQFKVNEAGKAVYGPLPSTIRIDMGSSSFVIPPNDEHTVYYKATSTASPATFSIIPTMTPASRTKGIRVNFCIPHMIYLYQKAKLAKSDVKVAMEDGKIVIENASTKLGRVEFIHAGSEDLNGFPIYPGQTRSIAITANKATVHFEEGFKVDVR
jgi:hypothetical protein